MPPLVTRQLRLTDSADGLPPAARWRDSAGVAYALTSGRLVIRATEADPTALVDIAATITGGDTAAVIIPKATIVAANFEGLPLGEAVWEMIVTRAIDGRTISIVGGDVLWSKGTAW